VKINVYESLAAVVAAVSAATGLEPPRTAWSRRSSATDSPPEVRARPSTAGTWSPAALRCARTTNRSDESAKLAAW